MSKINRLVKPQKNIGGNKKRATKSASRTKSDTRKRPGTLKERIIVDEQVIVELEQRREALNRATQELKRKLQDDENTFKKNEKRIFDSQIIVARVETVPYLVGTIKKLEKQMAQMNKERLFIEGKAGQKHQEWSEIDVMRTEKQNQIASKKEILKKLDVKENPVGHQAAEAEIRQLTAEIARTDSDYRRKDQDYRQLYNRVKDVEFQIERVNKVIRKAEQNLMVSRRLEILRIEIQKLIYDNQQLKIELEREKSEARSSETKIRTIDAELVGRKAELKLDITKVARKTKKDAKSKKNQESAKKHNTKPISKKS